MMNHLEALYGITIPDPVSVTLTVELYGNKEAELSLPSNQVAAFLEHLLTKYPGQFTSELIGDTMVRLVPHDPVLALGYFNKVRSI